MDISSERLKNLLGEAFDAGYSNSAELKSQIVDELLLRLQIADVPEFRIFKVEELRQMPQGSVFFHPVRGRGFIIAKQDGVKYMQFEKGQGQGHGIVVGFTDNSEPWDRPMQLLHVEK